MILYSDFLTIEDRPAATAVVTFGRPLYMVRRTTRRMEVVVRAPIVAAVADDWSVASGAGSPAAAAPGWVVTSAVGLEVEQQVSGDLDAAAPGPSWQVCEGTRPALLAPSLGRDTVTWRGEIELPSREPAGIDPARRLCIREIDWYDGPTTLPAAGLRPAPFVYYLALS